MDTPASPSAHDLLRRWIAACLAQEVRPPVGAFPLETAAAESVLPWLAYRLHQAGVLTALPASEQESLRQALRHCSLLHLESEAELERLAAAAAERGLRLLAFKGHSVARTLYPNPACRPTSDFDLLIDPAQLGPAQAWLADMGYSPLQAFVGTLWLGAQSWSWASAGGHVRFHADLHWDYTNRMYFRHRLDFDAIWAAAVEVPCGATTLHLPCPVDDLVLACVHLAAFDPGTHVRLIWLLDIHFLMGSLDAAQIDLLLQRAAAARALEACLLFGEQAAALGGTAATPEGSTAMPGDDRHATSGRAANPAASLQPVLDALRQAADARRLRDYRRTLRWRAWDLACYWARLPAAGKLQLFGDMARWIRAR